MFFGMIIKEEKKGAIPFRNSPASINAVVSVT
jgi:hypothetical protein